MFERFSDAARRVVVLAEDEARSMRHPAIDTEHILLGIFRQGEESGRSLEVIGLTADGLRDLVAQQSPPGEQQPEGHPPFTDAAKQVMLAAFAESRRASHREIVPPHLLLGVLAATDGAGARALLAAGIDPAETRARVQESLP